MATTDAPVVAESAPDQANETSSQQPVPAAGNVPPSAPQGTQPPASPPPSPSAPSSTPAAPSTTAPAITPAVFEPAPADLLAEIKAFEQDSCARYKFNNRWDVVLSILGILLSIAIVGAGFIPGAPWLTAILGAIVAAVVTAQKAFPFGQRATFYRIIIGQSRNLLTRSSQGVVDKLTTVNTLSSLRMDFAQQLPRGSSSQTSDETAPKPAKVTRGGPDAATSDTQGAATNS